MTKTQAIRKMMDGHKITHEYWHKGTYVWYDFVYRVFVEEDKTPIDLNNLNELSSPSGYKIYKEPVTKYRWVFSVNDNLIISPEYYSNEKELRANIVSKCDWCERIDNTAKEFYDD
jgi:uncharacterized protein YegP (UPF0339 family)